ncbi:Crp/Fnr family transcriptional regulator [Flavobacterium quisquiliarum]|jgi:CRP-like cAMP-binding protein|uniref:Crp/Fnr family transcriptional regulator n=1 Tax=Flavobacterium quisquiliarum TaxID=1834436 RepID=A0ABV8W7G2_9FLAO|nr:Crp/Fnr family transcriptional regulator [Flavobacterium quisquiliarum]MBW1654150.1 helix-turn-helix domain-containing protein [Flavobacterium quisquiliarum]NWL00858.1 transcriptional regulator [Flavobacterium collinsii]
MKEEQTVCYSCINENCFIKKHLHLEQMQSYISKKQNIICKKSDQFIVEGSTLQGLYFICKGKAKTVKTGINGREQIVRLTKSGDIIGFRGFGTGKKYLIGAYALEDTILCNFSNETILEILKQIPEFTYALMLFYAEELNKSENNIRKIAHMNVRERVVDLLLYIHRKFGQINGLIDIDLSRKEIADFAGTTEEQVIRVISSLKKEALIQTVGKRIGILKVSVLRSEIMEHKYF